MLWTDLSAMIYVVPLIVSALVALLVAVFISLTSVSELKCPICHTKFADVFGLRKHIKTVEEEKELPKRA
ncbi:MAG: C2H2-type zinc finger protein [Deltaproteobacteria bacterium]|nr:C2H2-type zinc finger protein [Deltaproteobacteria bacterium]